VESKQILRLYFAARESRTDRSRCTKCKKINVPIISHYMTVSWRVDFSSERLTLNRLSRCRRSIGFRYRPFCHPEQSVGCVGTTVKWTAGQAGQLSVDSCGSRDVSASLLITFRQLSSKPPCTLLSSYLRLGCIAEITLF